MGQGVAPLQPGPSQAADKGQVESLGHDSQAAMLRLGHGLEGSLCFPVLIGGQVGWKISFHMAFLSPMAELS